MGHHPVSVRPFGVVALILATAVAWAQPALTPYHAGYTIRDFLATRASGGTTPLTVAVWYPTDENEAVMRYGSGAEGSAARDGAPARTHAAYPLLVYSHGYGGGGINATYLTEHLARLGFVVVAPDHSDQHKAERIREPVTVDIKDYLRTALRLPLQGTKFDRAAYGYRPREVVAAIDGMLAASAAEGDALLTGLVGTGKVGIVGHSLGSFTALACAGAGKTYKDPRVGAVVCLSGGWFMWRAEDYQTVDVPVMLLYGAIETASRTAQFLADARRAYDNCRPPKFMGAVKDGYHETFTRSAMSRSDRSGRQREVIVAQWQTIKTRTAAMFARYLKSDQEAEKALTAADPMLLNYKYVLN